MIEVVKLAKGEVNEEEVKINDFGRSKKIPCC